MLGMRLDQTSGAENFSPLISSHGHSQNNGVIGHLGKNIVWGQEV